METSTKLLNLYDLIENNTKKETEKKKFYESILERCHRVITKYAKEHHIEYCNFTIPKFIIGLPPFDFDALKDYLITSLTNNGLYVDFIYPNTLFIAWDEKHRNLQQYKNILKQQNNTTYSNNSIDDKKNSVQPKTHKKIVENNNVGFLQFKNDDLIPINTNRLTTQKTLQL